MAGYPGSGKSSIVKEIINECGQHVLISGDHAEGEVGQYEYFTHRDFDSVAGLLKENISEWHDMSIIIDKPFLSVERGANNPNPEILGWAEQMQIAFPDANIVISLLDIPMIGAFELMKKRSITNESRGFIPKRLYNGYETFIENTYHNSDFIQREIKNAGYKYIPLPVNEDVLSTILGQPGGKKSRKKVRRRVKKTRRRNKSQYKYK